MLEPGVELEKTWALVALSGVAYMIDGEMTAR
jgi:hypothetical protein